MPESLKIGSLFSGIQSAGSNWGSNGLGWVTRCGKPSRMIFVGRCCRSTGRMRRGFQMSEKSPRKALNPSISFAVGSPAPTSVSLAKGAGSKARSRDSGGSSTESFASFDPNSLSWRTSQLSVLGDSPEFSGRWPRSGTMRSGIAYPLKPSAPLTAVTGSSWSRGEYPTPSAVSYGRNRGGGAGANTGPVRESLDTWARRLEPGPLAPTTCKHGGPCRMTLSPRFVEWLMGFPIGHTDLGHLETRSFRKSRK